MENRPFQNHERQYENRVLNASKDKNETSGPTHSSVLDNDEDRYRFMGLLEDLDNTT